MRLEILLEERSAEEAARILVPRIVAPGTTFRLHSHSGKQDLMGQLPSILRGYARSLGDDARVIVLLDRDGADCATLRVELERVARAARLPVRRGPGGGRPGTVAFRMAI